MSARKPYRPQRHRYAFGYGLSIDDTRKRCARQKCNALIHGQPARCPSCKSPLSKPLSKSV